MATPSLLDWIMDLLRNDGAREAFHSNPQAALQTAGFSQVCGEDVKDARTFVTDSPNVELVQDATLPEVTAAADDDAVEQIRYIVNNYTYNDSHDIYNYAAAPVAVDEVSDEGPEDEVTAADDEVVTGTNDPDGNDNDQANDDSNDSINDSEIGGDANLGQQDSFNPDMSTGETTVDQSGSTVDGDQTGRDHVEAGPVATGKESTATENNVSAGEDAAGRDMDNVSGGLAGIDHAVETGDIHVLSDLVNTDDILRDGSILNNLDVLSHVGEQNIVQDVSDVLDLF
jgi:hypothetical protein